MSTSSESIQLKRHHNNNNNKQKLLVIHGSAISPSYSVLSSEEDDNSIITFSDPGFGEYVACCHGLLLTVRDEYDEYEKFALWDPSTKDFFKTLPQPPRPPPSVEYKWINKLYGLGLAAPDDYKVIRYHRVIDVDDDYMESSCFMGYHVAELYSLKTDSWKRIPYPHAYKVIPIRDFLSDPVHINGFSYWPACTGPRNEHLAFLSFDFANEIFPCAPIPGPGGYKLGTHGQYHFLLAEFEGSLALVVHLVEDKLFELWVWNHDDKEESWSRRGAWAISGGVVVAMYPRALLKNHLFYFEDSRHELVLFDSAKQKWKKLGLCATQASLQTIPFFSPTRTT